jgi:glycerol-3-phosphate dehydrogenase
VRLTRSDVTLTYSGVRPLPYVAAGAEGSISRDHSVEVSSWDGIPVLTLVGGKLTTSRAFGELVADEVLHRLSMTRFATTVARAVPGGEAIPGDHARQAKFYEELALESHLDGGQVRAMWALCGSRLRDFLQFRERDAPPQASDQNISGSVLPRSFVHWMIESEWAERIEDLVERRLMLIYEPGLSRQTMGDLADLLVEAGKLDAAARDAAIETAVRRCREIYGRPLTA